jgi:hypothetical protein
MQQKTIGENSNNFEVYIATYSPADLLIVDWKSWRNGQFSITADTSIASIGIHCCQNVP